MFRGLALEKGIVIRVSEASSSSIKEIAASLANELKLDERSLVILDTSHILIREHSDQIISRLKYRFGIDSILITYVFQRNSMDSDLEEFVNEIKEKFSRERKRLQVFKLRALNKISEETRSKIIRFLIEKLGIKQRENQVDLTIYAFEKNDLCLLVIDKIDCIGGSYFSTNELSVSLVSGGPDSTLATLLACRSGIEVVGVYFDFGVRELRDKARQRVIRSIRLIANKWGRIRKLYIVPFVDVVQNILSFSDPRYFFVLLKRFMVRTAGIICKKEGCRAIITGEIIGEHASQTLWNLDVISEALADIPIIRPLLTWDKSEILNYLRKIDLDLYDVVSSSIEPCVVSSKIKPTTRAKLDFVKKEEENIPINDCYLNDLVEKSFKIMF